MVSPCLSRGAFVNHEPLQTVAEKLGVVWRISQADSWVDEVLDWL